MNNQDFPNNAPPNAGPPNSGDIHNTMSGNARVETQINHAVFQSDIYIQHKDDPPERKVELAEDFLDGGFPRKAEGLLGDVVRSGVRTSRIAYHYTLAILGDRTITDLSPDDVADLRLAQSVAQGFDDEWSAAVEVISNLLGCAFEQQRRDSPEQRERLAGVLDRFKGLSDERRGEVTRHLAKMLNGTVRDHVDRLVGDLIRTERIAKGRQRRARLFFHPDPTAPRQAQPYYNGRFDLRLWCLAVGGVLGFLVAVIAAFATLQAAAGVATVGFLALFVVGAGATCWFGADLLAYRGERRRHEFELGESGAVPPSRKQPEVEYGSEDFREQIDALVRYQFTRRELRRGVQRKQTDEWVTAMAGSAIALIARLIRTYGEPVERVDDEDDDSVYAGDLSDLVYRRGPDHTEEIGGNTLDWLIRWHAKRTTREWQEGTLHDFRKLRFPTVRSGLIAFAAVAVGLFGFARLVSSAQSWEPKPLTLLVLGCLALVGGLYGGVKLLGELFARRLELADMRRLHEEETKAYEEWRAVLADRPTDAEMATWLAWDKDYLKSTAMRRSNLVSSDIVGHIILVEGKANAKMGRVVYGPPRYSAYTVLIFLLTENGVRQVSVDLDFEDGAIHDENRLSFSYGSLTAVKVSEVGVQFAGERRQVLYTSRRNLSVTEATDNVVFSRALHIALRNQEDITVIVENPEGLHGTKTEDPDRLKDLALDASGVTASLHILEAIAAEGPKWVQREYERRNRRWDEWTGRSTEQRFIDTRRVRELGPGATDDPDVVDAEWTEED
ncbi:hypothetical protein [Actinokineospora inagensis]|uniref:hypothetical protein n=1 Tax=Actinokineospora inagensis TaxID=103730 RepID=UPI0004130339|nr:hypothetical protein [Actinokineospora inagensis]